MKQLARDRSNFWEETKAHVQYCGSPTTRESPEFTWNSKIIGAGVAVETTVKYAPLKISGFETTAMNLAQSE